MRSTEIVVAHLGCLIDTAPRNDAEAQRARDELAAVDQPMSDLVADELVRRMEDDVMAVLHVFSNHGRPIWFDSARDKLVAGLEPIAAEGPMYEVYVLLLKSMRVRRSKKGFFARLFR
jgi:hypothetical protein